MSCRSRPVVVKTPVPIMLATTIRVAVGSPSRRRLPVDARPWEFRLLLMSLPSYWICRGSRQQIEALQHCLSSGHRNTFDERCKAQQARLFYLLRQGFPLFCEADSFRAIIGVVDATDDPTRCLEAGNEAAGTTLGQSQPFGQVLFVSVPALSVVPSMREHVMWAVVARMVFLHPPEDQNAEQRNVQLVATPPARFGQGELHPLLAPPMQRVEDTDKWLLSQLISVRCSSQRTATPFRRLRRETASGSVPSMIWRSRSGRMRVRLRWRRRRDGSMPTASARSPTEM